MGAGEGPKEFLDLVLDSSVSLVAVVCRDCLVDDSYLYVGWEWLDGDDGPHGYRPLSSGRR